MIAEANWHGRAACDLLIRLCAVSLRASSTGNFALLERIVRQTEHASVTALIWLFRSNIRAAVAPIQNISDDQMTREQ